MIDLIQLRQTFTDVGLDVETVSADLYGDRASVHVRVVGDYPERETVFDYLPDGIRISRVSTYEREDDLMITSFSVTGPDSIPELVVALVVLVADVVHEQVVA